MSYAQSTVKGHIRAKQNVSILHVKFGFTTYNTSHSWGSEKFGENKVEQTEKAETRQLQALSAGAACKAIF